MTALMVLDASAVISALLGEPAGPEVEKLLRGRPPPSISAVNLAEVIDRLVRLGRRDSGAVRDRIDWLIAGGLQVEPVWLSVARLAASLRALHYNRTTMPISMADCICLATAINMEAFVATTDADLARLGKRLGLQITTIPNSMGVRPAANGLGTFPRRAAPRG